MLFDEYDVVDLTLLLDEELPATWPPHVPFQRHVWNWFETAQRIETWVSRSGAYFTESLLLDEHIGTHFDAPAHFLMNNTAIGAEPRTGDLVSLRQLCGPAVVVNVTNLKGTSLIGQSPYITADAIQTWESLHGRLKSGEVVLFRSDWDQDHYKRGVEGNGYAFDVAVTKTQAGWPAPDVSCMELLFERGIGLVGTDGPSMGSAHDGGPVHVFGLSNSILFVEGLSELKKLPTEGAYFQFLPLKVSRSSGGPGRAIGWVPRTPLL